MRTETDKKEIADEKTAKWLQEETTVAMSNELWLALAMYIEHQELVRKTELEQWEEFALEVDENGEPEFINAELQVEFLREREQQLKEIMQHINQREGYAERSQDEADICEV